MSTLKEVQYIAADHCYIFECPHCNFPVQVSEHGVKCGIFRHATMKSTGKQINPHAPQDHCDRLLAQDLVYGCTKPFKLFRGPNGAVSHADKCAYI